jgi:hypothetical protein
MRPAIYIPALLLSLFAGWAAAAQTAQPDAPAERSNVQLTFETLDGDRQQVNVDEIWRVRAATTHDEPAGSVLINYAYERIFVKDALQSVIDRVSRERDVTKFTLPSGEPVYIVTSKVIGINKPIAQRDHQKSGSVIVMREGRQQVQEARERVRELLAN